MGTFSKYNDEHAIYRLVLEHLNLKDDVQLRVDEYGKDMYLISIGKMSNPFDLRAVSFSMQTIFMTDDEIESSLDKMLDSLHSHFVERDMIKSDVEPIKEVTPDEQLLQDLIDADVSQDIIEKVKALMVSPIAVLN